MWFYCCTTIIEIRAESVWELFKYTRKYVNRYNYSISNNKTSNYVHRKCLIFNSFQLLQLSLSVFMIWSLISSCPPSIQAFNSVDDAPRGLFCVCADGSLYHHINRAQVHFQFFTAITRSLVHSCSSGQQQEVVVEISPFETGQPFKTLMHHQLSFMLPPCQSALILQL